MSFHGLITFFFKNWIIFHCQDVGILFRLNAFISLLAHTHFHMLYTDTSKFRTGMFFFVQTWDCYLPAAAPSIWARGPVSGLLVRTMRPVVWGGLAPEVRGCFCRGWILAPPPHPPPLGLLTGLPTLPFSAGMLENSEPLSTGQGIWSPSRELMVGLMVAVPSDSTFFPTFVPGRLFSSPQGWGRQHTDLI